MQKLKVDACIVTKRSPVNYYNVAKNIPVNKIIIETSRPLGLARKRAIHKVETEWFAFIDDDVVLTETWFDTITSFIECGVGAIQGLMHVRGLGKRVDRDLNALKPRRVQELRLGQRGYTHNTLIRTKLVADWKPSRQDLSAWEDYEITQHILKRGYKWLVVPVDACHLMSWRKIWKNAVWNMRNWRKISNQRLWPKDVNETNLNIFHRFVVTLSRVPWDVRFYLLYKLMASTWGLLK